MQPSKLVAMVLVAMFMSLNAACENRPDSEADKAAQVTSQDVKQETKQAVDTTAQYLEQEKEAFQNKLESKISEYDQNLDELKAKAQAMSADAQTEINQKIATLEAQKDALSKKAEELKATSADAWKEMSIGIDKALDELETSYQEAVSQFNK